jgi:O-antigen ligase
LMLEFVIYFLFLERRWYVRCAAVACGLVAALLLANMFMQSDFKLVQKYDQAAQRGLEDGSINERLKLTANGIWMALETSGRGVGASGYEETLAAGDVLLPLRAEKRGALKPAHNTWIQILSEYGVLPFVGLMALLAWIARLGWAARRQPIRGPGPDRGMVARAVLVALVGYAFYGIQAGSVLGHSHNWMFLASVSVLGAFLYDAKHRQQAPDCAAGAATTPVSVQSIPVV